MPKAAQQLKPKFHLRQCVKVKPGVKDPDFNVEIGGWQGRIADFDRSVAPRDEEADVAELRIEIEDDLTLKCSRLANPPV